MATLEPWVEETAREVIGAAIEVHRTLGPGFVESVYESAMCIELEIRGLEHVRQAPVTATYKGHPVGQGRADLIVRQCVLVELKAVEQLLPVHEAQAIHHLKATGLRLALLLNFHVPVLAQGGLRRIIL